MTDMMKDLLDNNTVKVCYFAALLVLLVLITYYVTTSKGSLSEALYSAFIENMGIGGPSDWSAGTPVMVESRQGYGYVDSPLPYSGGSGTPFPINTATNMKPYSAGYVERVW